MTPYEWFDRITEQVERFKPELVQEWKSLQSRRPFECGVFLTEHFPADGGWMTLDINDVPRLLSEWKPK